MIGYNAFDRFIVLLFIGKVHNAFADRNNYVLFWEYLNLEI